MDRKGERLGTYEKSVAARLPKSQRDVLHKIATKNFCSQSAALRLVLDYGIRAGT